MRFQEFVEDQVFSPTPVADALRTTNTETAAYAWFRAEPLPGFGGATPDQLLREGRAAHVHAYLDRIMAGGYA